MSSRKIRRAEAHKARKAARKAGFPNTVAQPSPVVTNANLDPQSASPDPQEPQPSVSEARAQAARQNGAQSRGPLTPETRAVSAQNHTTHGLARHRNGTFKLLSSEDPAAFRALQESLIAEHNPQTTTESILVDRMAESDWLALRAQNLQDTCLDPATGQINDEKKFNLYLRYQTTHTRAFNKCLTDLIKLRTARDKVKLGFEAQKIASQKHEMKKEHHEWDIAKKDALTCQEISRLLAMNIEAGKTHPTFHEEFEAELTRRGFQVGTWGTFYRAA